MTLPKLPLPTTRFVIMDYKRTPLFELIPATTPKRGRIIPDLWNLPGGVQRHTSQLVTLCKQRGWKWRVGEASKLTVHPHTTAAVNLKTWASRRRPS